MNSFRISSDTGIFGFSTYVQLPPANGNGTGARSAIPWSAAQATCTVPVAGWGKLNRNCPGAPKVMLAAGTPLIRRSDAWTPVTGSLKNTSMLVKERFFDPGGGDI